MHWLMALDRGFMEGYGLMPDPMEPFDVSCEKMKQGLPTKPFSVCFETEDEELAIMFKLRFADALVEPPDVQL